MLLCQPEALRIWPRGLYQVKKFSYTRSSIFKVVGLMLHKVKEHRKLLVFPPNKPSKLRFECTLSRAQHRALPWALPPSNPTRRRWRVPVAEGGLNSSPNVPILISAPKHRGWSPGPLALGNLLMWRSHKHGQGKYFSSCQGRNISKPTKQQFPLLYPELSASCGTTCCDWRAHGMRSPG